MKKNTLKKLMALGCAAALSLSLIGCSGGSDSANDTSAETTEETTDTAGTEASDTAGTDAAAGDSAEYTILFAILYRAGLLQGGVDGGGGVKGRRLPQAQVQEELGIALRAADGRGGKAQRGKAQRPHRP